MINKDHIVVLKKIPVDPRHVGALRIHRDVIPPEETRTSHPHHESGKGEVSLVYRVFSFFLFSAFLVNPIGVAYAEEVTPLPDAPSESQAAESETPPQEPGVTVVLPPSEEEKVAVEDVPTGNTETPPPSSEASSSDATTTAPVEPSIGGSTEETGTSSASSTEPLTEGDATSTASSTEEIPGTVGGGNSETPTASSTDDTLSSTEETINETAEEEEYSQEEASSNLDREQSPEERAAERVAAEAVMREQLKREVEAEMRSRCVSYGDDGYYCLDEASASRVTGEKPTLQVVSDRDPSGGDKEIVVIRSFPEGESREFITKNDTDDEFPNADGEMKMIVWQSLVGGRWQIAYKEGTGTVEYLTANQDGNGHPATDGKRIVWQGWSGSHWDIFLAEPGEGTLSFSATSSGVLLGIHPGWKVTKLSESPSHDMFPKIAGNFVTWQEHRGESWVVVVYDLATGQSRAVEGEAGGTGEAPTVALIFKERTKEGRVFIRASDLATGERIPLRDDELPEPKKLPIPEQSGALPLQNGTSSVTTIRPEGEGDGGGTPTL